MILAHGVGSRGDLPLPLWMFTWASAIALGVSFVALSVLWTRPQLARASAGHSLFGQAFPLWLRLTRWVGQALALVLFVVSVAAGVLGTDSTAKNLLPVTLYVVVWVGAQVVGGLVGDIWQAVNPLVTLGRGVEFLAAKLGRRPSEAPGSVGLWPAAAGLFAFLFLELAHPSGSSPKTLGWVLVVHTVVCLVLAYRWGADWLVEHEPFSALFSMIGQLAPLYAAGGGLRVRAPISGVSVLPVRPGSLAVLLIVLGGTTFDGFSESEAGRELLGRPTGWSGAATLTLWLLISIAIVAMLFVIGVWWTQRVTHLSMRGAADAFTPSLVPIVFGYAIAHYAQLLVDETQTFVFRLSDPFGQGWDLFGGSDAKVDFAIVSPDAIAWIQVLAILFGHIGAVVVAHDRSVELFEPEDSLRSQFAMLLVMVAYSTLGLWLLLNA